MGPNWNRLTAERHWRIVREDVKITKSVNANNANTLGVAKVSMGRGFRFGSRTGAAVLA